MVNVSGAVGSFQSGEEFCGLRAWSIESLLMSGCGRGDGLLEQGSINLWLKFRVLPPSRRENTLFLSQSHVGIENYSVVYFKCITAFKVRYHWSSVEGRAHMHFVNSLDIYTSAKHIWAPHVQQYNASNTVMRRNNLPFLHGTVTFGLKKDTSSEWPMVVNIFQLMLAFVDIFLEISYYECQLKLTYNSMAACAIPNDHKRFLPLRTVIMVDILGQFGAYGANYWMQLVLAFIPQSRNPF